MNHLLALRREFHMSTLAQIEQIVQRVLGPRARETSCVRRHRKLDGADLVQAFVFGYLQQTDSTSEELLHCLQRRAVTVSASALSQHSNEQTATFVRRLLQELSAEYVQAEEPAPVELLGRFEAVIVEDSSTLQLPDALQTVWRGHGGGQGQSHASLKLHLRWDLKRGGLQGPVRTSGRHADQRSPLREQGISQEVLCITDERYSDGPYLKEQPGYFLTRVRSTARFYDPQTGREVALEQCGPRYRNETWQGEVLVGRPSKLPARLILIRVPEDIERQRQTHIRKEAKRHGHPVNPKALSRAKWTILVTNLPEFLALLSEVVVLQRARWQIERLFLVWKHLGEVDDWQGRTPWRMLIEIYAKLMAMLIGHWLLVVGTWQDPSRSI